MSPYAAARPCAEPRCPELVRGALRRCVTHQAKYDAAYDRDRGSPDKRGYGTGWRGPGGLREQILNRDRRLCQDCLANGRYTEATQVDHVLSKRQGGTDDPSNLRSLCAPCHSRKTAREDARWGIR